MTRSDLMAKPLTAALASWLAGTTALAATPATLGGLLSPQDLPGVLQGKARGQSAMVMAGLPTAPWGLQLCSTGPGGKQVSIAGPATSDRLLLPLNDDNSLVLSASLYRFASAAEAEQAWTQVRATAPRCRGSVRGPGNQSSTLSSGGSSWIWILNQQRHDAAARYTTFNRHGAVILVTGLSRVGDSVISPAEQTAVQQVAARIGQRLQAEP
jgi:hypothetical protein